jgi:hypothetical protein
VTGTGGGSPTIISPDGNVGWSSARLYR